MRAIVAESAVAVQAMQGTGDDRPNGAMKVVLPSVLSGRSHPRG
jgi:hypothetical protein